jgi:hypothetical protein
MIEYAIRQTKNDQGAEYNYIYKNGSDQKKTLNEIFSHLVYVLECWKKWPKAEFDVVEVEV